MKHLWVETADDIQHHTTRSWPSEYYAMIAYYCFEPQTLGLQRKVGSSSVDFGLARVSRAEVPLNHLLSVFFNLAPGALTQRLLAGVFADWTSEPLRKPIRPELHAPFNVAQVDLLFEGPTSRIGLEMKIGHRSGLDQIIKYAFFLRVYGSSEQPSKRTPYLLILCRDRAALWPPKESFPSPELILKAELPRSVKRYGELLKLDDDVVRGWAADLRIETITYQELHDRLQHEHACLSSGTESEETLRRLIEGLMEECRRRNLAAWV